LKMKILGSIRYDPFPIKGGYTDQILRVGLTSYGISAHSLPADFKDKYIGGRGYALELSWDMTSRKILHDSPENVLVSSATNPGFRVQVSLLLAPYLL